MKPTHTAESIRALLGENLKKIRVSRKMTQVDFAKSVGLNQGEVSSYETGARGFTADSLADLANRIVVEPGALFDSTGAGNDRANEERKIIEAYHKAGPLMQAFAVAALTLEEEDLAKVIALGKTADPKAHKLYCQFLDLISRQEG